MRRLVDLASVFESDVFAGIVGITTFKPPFSLTATPGEDTTFVVARHRSGLVSRLLHSWGIPKRTGLLDLSKIWLEKGAVYFDSRGLFGIVLGSTRRFIPPSLADRGGYEAMWGHFLGMIRDGEPPQLTLEDIFADFSIIDAAYRSVQSGKEERPEPIPSSLSSDRNSA